MLWSTIPHIETIESVLTSTSQYGMMGPQLKNGKPYSGLAKSAQKITRNEQPSLDPPGPWSSHPQTLHPLAVW